MTEIEIDFERLSELPDGVISTFISSLERELLAQQRYVEVAKKTGITQNTNFGRVVSYDSLIGAIGIVKQRGCVSSDQREYLQGMLDFLIDNEELLRVGFYGGRHIPDV